MTDKKEKCILLIDMDGVVFDWVGGIYNRVKESDPELSDKLVPYENLTEFYIETVHPEEVQPAIVEAKTRKGLYNSLPPLQGAIEALKDIEENCSDFIDAFICSSPVVVYEDCMSHSEKVQSIKEHLGDYWVKRLILTKDKTLVRGHFLIDDKPEITGAMNPTWNQIVYDQPWNRSVGDGANSKGFTWADWPSLRDVGIKPMFNVVEQPRIVTLN